MVIYLFIFIYKFIIFIPVIVYYLIILSLHCNTLLIIIFNLFQEVLKRFVPKESQNSEKDGDIASGSGDPSDVDDNEEGDDTDILTGGDNSQPTIKNIQLNEHTDAEIGAYVRALTVAL